jgi:predicted 2-oxoglutarate/Fe(II)-dependent dioxygenase YbiX
MNEIKFTIEECEKIISLSNIFEKHYSSEWWQSNETIYLAWHITRNEVTEWIFERLTNYLESSTKIRLIEPLSLIHLQNVQSGNKFEPHVDKRSEFNIGVCLNDDYEGGELICYNPKIVIPKVKGSIYSFYGSKLHEVKEVTMGERWSLISFISKSAIKREINII